MNENLIKALRCVASQNEFDDCYIDKYNREKKEDEPMMTCKVLPGTIPCPYRQEEYPTNCGNGDCFDWMNQIADILEGK